MKGLIKKAVAEIIGTFVLVFCACGVATFTGGEPVATSLAFGLVIVAMAYSIGRISGCHINPAVSLGCLLTKRMTVKEFFVYVGSQIVGGFVGAVALYGLIRMGGLEVPANAACDLPNFFGTQGATAGTVIGALLVEVVLTFIFVYVILNVTSAKSEATKKSAGLIIGLTLTLVHLIGIPFTGTSVNPARSLATALGCLIFGDGVEAIKFVWIFFVGPLAGAAVAALVYKAMHKED